MSELFHQWKYKALFGILLVVSMQWPSFEFLIGLLILVTIFFLNTKNRKTSGNFITAILPLFIILFLGILSSLFYPYNLLDIAKDIAYFIKPILLLFIGYSIIHAIKSPIFLFKIFIYLAIAFAIIHLIRIITFPNLFSANINKIRNETGLSNLIELLALIFIFLSFKYSKISVFKNRSMTISVLGLLIISFVLYFSRTMWISVFIILLAAFGYAKISLKALKYIGIVFLIIGGFYIYLFSIDIDRNEPGISVFLYKMKIAPEEIFMPKIDLNNHAALWDHWRAYEAQMAFNQIHGYQHLIGRGFGSLVDLHFAAPLNDDGMRYISHLHNGYAMIYFKTGIIGILFYLTFILNLYLFTFYKKSTNPEIPITNLIAAIGLYLLFSSLIVSGIYNLEDPNALALGGLIAYFDKLKLSNPK